MATQRIDCTGPQIGNQVTVGTVISNRSGIGFTTTVDDEPTIEILGELSQTPPEGSTVTRDFSNYYVTLRYYPSNWSEKVYETSRLIISLQSILVGKWTAKIIEQKFNGAPAFDMFVVDNEGDMPPYISYVIRKVGTTYLYRGLYEIVIGVTSCDGHPCDQPQECLINCDAVKATDGVVSNTCLNLSGEWVYRKIYPPEDITQLLSPVIGLKIHNQVAVTNGLILTSPIGRSDLRLTFKNLGAPLTRFCIQLNQFGMGEPFQITSDLPNWTAMGPQFISISTIPTGSLFNINAVYLGRTPPRGNIEFVYQSTVTAREATLGDFTVQQRSFVQVF